MFNTYVGNWGSKEAVWRFEGLIDGKVVARQVIEQALAPSLQLKCSTNTLSLGLSTYDMAQVGADNQSRATAAPQLCLYRFLSQC